MKFNDTLGNSRRRHAVLLLSALFVALSFPYPTYSHEQGVETGETISSADGFFHQ
jgi:hypothetical protein